MFNVAKCRVLGLSVAAAALLAACGGGDPLPPKVPVAKVTVMGDSLSDVGTFGFKFTVQKSGDAAGYPIWTQLVANAFGLDGAAQCNYYMATSAITFMPNPLKAGCTNFAIGGGRIVSASLSGEQLITKQLSDRKALGAYADNEILLIDGGGNDAADLVGAYLAAASDGGLTLQGLLAQLLSPGEMGAAFAQDATGALAVGAYMQKLATTFHDSIKSNALDNGAKRVLILNMPDITLTPRFKAVLMGVAMQTSQAQADALQAGIRQWIGAFNSTLSGSFASDSRVAITDFYADLNDQAAHYADYSLDNASLTACPAVGVDSSGLPAYDFPTCTDAALDAQAGKSAGWWRHYAFSDGFHPTPYGHHLLSASVARTLARAGWL